MVITHDGRRRFLPHPLLTILSMPIRQIAPPALDEFLRAQPQTTLLDVREQWEHDLVALPDSLLIPLGELMRRAEEDLPDHDAPIVVYCHHGIRSLQACALLASLGYGDLINLSGGIDRYGAEVDNTLPTY